MTELSLDQLSYMAAKARLPVKLVLDAGKVTVERFMDSRKSGQAIQDFSPRAVEPMETLLTRIPLVKEVSTAK